MLLGKDVTDEVNILIGGADSAERDAIAECLVSMKYPFDNKTVRTTRTLPLPQDDARPRIDFIVIVLDLASQLSYESGERLLMNLPTEYVPARSMLMLVNAETPGKYSVSLDDVLDLAYGCCVPVQYCTIDDQSCVFEACLAISRKCMSTLRVGGLSSLFGQCLQNEIVQNTDLPTKATDEVEAL